jgi:type II secretory pathway predicted ATPase ExeA
MYLEHFKLRDYPFRLTPDTEFLYLSAGHARAKTYLDYCVWNREGFVVLTGEIGSGKTLLIQNLISGLNEENVLVARIFQTQLNDVEFLQAVLVEFGLDPFGASKVELLDMLDTFLVGSFSDSRQLVLVVDDAHNLGREVLEEIRMLSGLETQKHKLMQVILVGQPALNDLLDSPCMEQLLQRVRLRYHIRALSQTEVGEYIAHRLRVAGADDARMFAPESIPLIYRYTGGIPRLVNTLCDTALVCGYADGAGRVTPGELKSAIIELRWPPYAKRAGAISTRSRHAHGTVGRDENDESAFVQISKRLTQLDALAPAMSRVSDRMGNVESLLRELVGTGNTDSASDPQAVNPSGPVK